MANGNGIRWRNILLTTALLLLLPLALLAADAPEAVRIGHCDGSDLVAGAFPRRAAVTRGMGTAVHEPNYIGDYSGLEEVLVAGWADRSSSIDVWSWKLTPELFHELYFNIMYLHGEFFYLDNSYSYSYDGKGRIVNVSPHYTTTDSAVIAEMQAEVDAATAAALAMLDDGMSDVEKTLVLHDYLCSNCEYDYSVSQPHIRDIYGALVLRRVVCAGYTVAYNYLLRLAGIASDYVSSEEMNHAWNVVRIDGEWYHVDVTWDDVDEHRNGFTHANLLRSDAGIASTGHGAWDYPEYVCGSTRFDEHFWTTAGSGCLPVIDGVTYAIDKDAWELWGCDAESGVGEALLELPEEPWYVWGSKYSYWTGIYNQLAWFHGLLAYSTRDAVCIYDPCDGTTDELDTELPDTGYCYGLRLRSGTALEAVSRQSPNASGPDSTYIAYTAIPWTPVAQVAVTPDSLDYLVTGPDDTAEVQLTAAVLPDNATWPAVSWQSDNEAVASVTPAGLVTIALDGAGSATISATSHAGGVVGQCLIQVAYPVYTISVTASPEQGGLVTGGGDYDTGETDSATMTATPNEHYDFVQWEKDGQPVAVTAEYTAPLTGDAEYIAIFQLQQFAVEAAANVDERGSVSGAGIYDYGTEITLAATPEDGFRFAGWELNGDVVSTNASYTFTVTGAASYTAVFEFLSYDIAVQVNDAEFGEATGAGTYDYGTQATLTATPVEGYRLAGWELGGEIAATANPYVFTVTGAASYTAVFELKPYTLILDLPSGWSTLGLPFDLDDEGRQKLAQLLAFLVDDGTKAPVRCDLGTPLPAKSVLWLYNPEATALHLVLSGSCSAETAVQVTGRPCLVTPMMDSELPDAATLEQWGANAWNPQVRRIQSVDVVHPGQVLFLKTPPAGDIFPVPME